MAQNIKYRLLDEEFFPKFVTAFKAFVLETEKHEIEPRRAEHFLMMTIANMKNPQYLFLLATIGKRVAGFCLMFPYDDASEKKTVLWNGIYVKPDMRTAGIGQALFDNAYAWSKQTGYQRMIAFEEFGSKKWLRKKRFPFVPVRQIIQMEVK